MDTKRKAFTLTELLVVIAIIALLVGLAVPTLVGAKKMAKEMREKNNLTNMEMAIEQFKQDHGFYPESGLRSPGDDRFWTLVLEKLPNKIRPVDQGAHRLFESLVGLDYYGYQKQHYYYRAFNKPPFADGTPLAENPITHMMEVTKRWGPYVELDDLRYGTMAEAHPNGDKFVGGNANDVFLDQLEYTEPRAILYYRARKVGRVIWDSDNISNSIYNFIDNSEITLENDTLKSRPYHYIEQSGGSFVNSFDEVGFVKSITDPRTITATVGSELPYKKDSYLLIGAGWDHKYGTEDDITNFER